MDAFAGAVGAERSNARDHMQSEIVTLERLREQVLGGDAADQEQIVDRTREAIGLLLDGREILVARFLSECLGISARSSSSRP